MTDLITITGNLAAEPEHKTLANGVTVTNFRVGSTHRRFDKSTGQWVDAWAIMQTAHTPKACHARTSIRY